MEENECSECGDSFKMTDECKAVGMINPGLTPEEISDPEILRENLTMLWLCEGCTYHFDKNLKRMVYGLNTKSN